MKKCILVSGMFSKYYHDKPGYIELAYDYDDGTSKKVLYEFTANDSFEDIEVVFDFIEFLRTKIHNKPWVPYL